MNERENLESIGHAMMLAWGRVKKAQRRMWGEWMTIGEGLLAGRQWAMRQAGTNKPEGKGFVMNFSEWLKRFKVDDMDKSDRAKLLQLMEERPAVEEWRAGLPDQDRMRLNNPTIVWRKWTAATRVKKPKPRSAGVSATEHGRAQGIIEELQARNAELEEELQAQKGADDTRAIEELSLLQLIEQIRRLMDRAKDAAEEYDGWPNKRTGNKCVTALKNADTMLFEVEDIVFAANQRDQQQLEELTERVHRQTSTDAEGEDKPRPESAPRGAQSLQKCP
jgi:hypothetical protein